MLSGLVLIQVLLLCEMVKSIYVYNSGNPDEDLSSEFEAPVTDHFAKYEYPSGITEKYIYPYGSVDKDYGIINMSLFGMQNPSYTSSTKLSNTKRTKNRVGFYNVQTGDEFFLNDFDVRPKFKTKQSNKQIIGYEYSTSEANKRKDQVQSQKFSSNNKPIKYNTKYQQNTTRRPQQNNKRKVNNTVNKRRKPNTRNRKPPRRNNRKPLANSNKNSIQNNRNKNKNSQKNRRKVQQQYNIKNGCRHPNMPVKNINRRPLTNKHFSNKKQPNVRKKQPVRKFNNQKQNNRYINKPYFQNKMKRKPNNRFKQIQSRNDNFVSDVIKRYLLRLKSNNTLDSSRTDFGSRQRSLFGMTLNKIREQSLDFANKFLSFFTVVQHQNYECTADSEFNYYEGVCYQENQCLKIGGTAIGKCENFGSCCILRATCGESSSQNCTYFESPLYPNYFPANGTEFPDLHLDTSNTEFGVEEITQPTLQQPNYHTDESTDEEFYTDFIDDSATETSYGTGDQIFVDTDILKEMSDDLTYEDSLTFDTFTERPIKEEFDDAEYFAEDLLSTNSEYIPPEVNSGNKYKEYAIAKENNFIEHFACMFTVIKMSENVQQMKIEFLDLELMGPDANGDCIDEKLMISGQNMINELPIICGYNSGQHVYVDVSTLSGPLQISILSNNVYRKRYKIRVCQLETPCVNSMNCLQYYTNHQGIISSFNYDQAVTYARSEPQYLNNLNYAICIRKDVGYCSVTFTNIDEENIEYPFDIENTSSGNDKGVLDHELAKEYNECLDDFILINNMRICGQNFQTITDTRPGPTIMIPVQTNVHVTGMGFKLIYRQNRCTS